MKENLRSSAILLIGSLFAISSCTSSKNLSYLDNLPASGSEEHFKMEIPDYRVQPRDILYITLKAMAPAGTIIDLLATSNSSQGISIGQSESSEYLYGYDVNAAGEIVLPVVGHIKVSGFTLDETIRILQTETEKIFKGATVECKLLSFKFTVIGEVNSPGMYINYNNYLTVLEAIGRAGGINDYGRRDKVLVLRPTTNGTRTFTLNLQDKQLLSSEAYFLLPNDVIIVEPEKHKIFNLNLPTISFILTTVTSAITTTLLLINYFK
jgi:polysaccharide export outer membrane protein